MTTSAKEYTTELIEHRWLSKKTFEIKLQRPAAFNFKPGQRISLKYEGVERDYSLSSSPEEPHVTLCIRHVDAGLLSPSLELRGRLGLGLEIEGS